MFCEKGNYDCFLKIIIDMIFNMGNIRYNITDIVMYNIIYINHFMEIDTSYPHWYIYFCIVAEFCIVQYYLYTVTYKL